MSQSICPNGDNCDISYMFPGCSCGYSFHTIKEKEGHEEKIKIDEINKFKEELKRIKDGKICPNENCDIAYMFPGCSCGYSFHSAKEKEECLQKHINLFKSKYPLEMTNY